MKRVLPFFMCILITLCCYVNAEAVSYVYDGYYSVDVPENFGAVSENNFISEDGASFVASYEENAEKKSYADMSKKDVLQYGEALVSKSTEAFAAFGKEGKMELVSAEKVKHSNGYTAIVIVMKTSMTDGDKTVSNLQKMYEFSCTENMYRFIYTPDKDEDIDKLDETFASIEIYEAEIKGVVDKIIDAALLFAIFLLIFAGIFKFIRGKKK